MRLPKDILSPQVYAKPNLYLCETDKTKICKLDTIEMSGNFKFNAYSELNFTVSRMYTDIITGETKVNPFYHKIEALRLVYLEGFGYFEIQDPEIVSDGIKEIKNVTAYSYEYTLSQKYLENFYVNTGDTHDIGVNSDGSVTTITLYDPVNKNASLCHLILEKIYGWTIEADDSIATMSRKFEVSRTSVYDFIMQDICDKFNCFAVFDTVNNKISLHAESLITKFIGDGESSVFILNQGYKTLKSVSINGYKTTDYQYQFDYKTDKGTLLLNSAPNNGAVIEVIDGYQEKWITDVYVAFDNLAQEVNISYSADDIKTVLTVKGAEDLDIREVNMGLPYIVDLSYYYSVDWMGQDLFDAYTLYLQKCNNGQDLYKSNSIKMLELNQKIAYENNRLSLQYSIADHVTSTTVGTYYIKGGSAPNFYYTEVSLPADYKANTIYYTLSGNDLDTTKFAKLYEAFKTYFNSQDQKDISKIQNLKNEFAFMETYTIDGLANSLLNAKTLIEKDTAILQFLDELWNQLGKTPLQTSYYSPYKTIEVTNKEAGWGDDSNANYWLYYPVTLVLKSLDDEIEQRDTIIASYNEQYNKLQSDNSHIAADASIYNHFTYEQLIRLSAFLREDEYTDDNFVQTETDTTEILMQTKQELLECGRIELSKLCEPKLAFSMDMANIYALSEFDPIIHQFQLGNLINVVMRPDYIKRARLLEVNINFDDFSDFSCEFGELTNLKTPSSIHADLLASALSAGKSVASNASYWTQGADKIDSLTLQIQKGLLDAATTIKAIDGSQGVEIDKSGIHLRKYDLETGALDSKEGWIVNNQFLYSDDNFNTTKSVFGEYKINGESRWGVLSEAVMAGYVGGSTIEGGRINIGDGAFVVDDNGNVTMKATNSIEGYATSEQFDDLGAQIKINADAITSKVNSGDFGTLIEQNYDHVKIAWNNNSKYIAFEDGALNIYTSSSHSTDTLLMKQNYQGAWYYYNGYTIGKIGTNSWTGDISYRGLVFDLGNDANYMCWAHKDNADDTSYTVKLIYHANDEKRQQGLHFECDTYANGHLYLNDDYRVIKYTDGSIGYSGEVSFVEHSDTSSASFRIDGTTKMFEIFGGSTFKVYNNVAVDCYSNINMHGFDLVDAEVTTSSDVRLKTNIQDTTVNALSLINQIEMKEFDWIESSEHEEIGMIAQQLQIIMPDLVYEDKSTGKLAIKTNKFIPYLLKAVQELSEVVMDNDVSTYGIFEKWVDEYDDSTKDDFVQMITSNEQMSTKITKIESTNEPTIIPLNE